MTTGWNLSGGAQGETLGRSYPPPNNCYVFKAIVDPQACWKQNKNGKAYFASSFVVSRGEHAGKGGSENFYLPTGEAEKDQFKLTRISWLVQAFLPGTDLSNVDPTVLPQINGREGVMYVESRKDEASGRTYHDLTPIRQRDAQNALAGRYHPRQGLIGDPVPAAPPAGFSPTTAPVAAAPVAAVAAAPGIPVTVTPVAAPAAAPVATPGIPANGVQGQQGGLDGLFNNMP